MITLDSAQKLSDTLSAIRRTLHQHPELGFRETWTGDFLAEKLASLGIRVQRGVGVTGVVGELGEGGPVVALRADMDALPIQEQNPVAYASQVPGVMHACGHDAHMACTLGAAMLLAQEKALPGRVRFLFQPSEEYRAEKDDKGGAARMVEDGAMEGVEAVFGLHVSHSTPVGKVEVSPGAVMARTNMFKAKVLGKACHGAQPQDGIDAILLAAQVVTALNTIVSRRIPPWESAVLSLGTIHGGTGPNVIADVVELSGTIRTYAETTYRTILEEMERAFSLARTLGGDYTLAVDKGIPEVFNAPELAEFARKVAIELLGKENVLPELSRMVGEDFSLLARAAKKGGCFLFLGVKGEKERPWHSPHFDIEESALPIGAAILAETARRYLENSRGQ